MDFEDTPAEAAFRAQVRDWLAANAPEFERPASGHLPDAEEVALGKAWQKRKAQHGYAGILTPTSLGGKGGTMTEAVIFGEEEGRYRLPVGPYVGIGLGMALIVIHKHGTPEQIERFAAPTLNGDITWCQLFSEPGAGSDLAGLRTRAVRDGNDWVVNGQKVWSSWAHHSDWGILIARTDPTVPKHKGLTFFVVDMKSPGIEVRPIRQISGLSDFNETFLTDVRIPDSGRIGAVGEGWACAMTTLMGERLNQGDGEQFDAASLFRYASATPRDGGTAADDGAARLRLAQFFAAEQGERFFQARLRTMLTRGENPGALASVFKLAFTNRFQQMTGYALELRGPAGIAAAPADADTANIQADYIWSSALRIAGGADQVLRNQISERVLQMPGEVRVDKDVPFDRL